MAWTFGILIVLALSGCGQEEKRRNADGIAKERLHFALSEAAEAYAKARFAKGEPPQPTVSVKQLLAWGFLKEADVRGLKDRNLLVAVDVEPVEQFSLAPSDIEQVFVGDGSSKIPAQQKDGHDVCLKLTTSCADALRQLTGRIIGRKLRVSAGSVTIVEARVASEVPGPWVIVSTSSKTQASEVAARLNRFATQAKEKGGP